MTTPPRYLLPRPVMPDDRAVLTAFDQLFDDTVSRGPGSVIGYDLIQPRWQFICHLADTREIVLHGSANPDITTFEPRQPDDTTEFGNQNAVYAASDGLWPMYFAILDRANHPMSLINACLRWVRPGGAVSDPYYFFSISREALQQQPFARGCIYFLPRHSFIQQPPEYHHGQPIQVAQWASPDPVVPLARIEVGPEDFPFLDRLRSHDHESTFARARADPGGFPWLDPTAGPQTR